MNVDKHTDFELWKAECERLGLKGPVRLGGYQNFGYFDKVGEQVAAWHGALDEGHINGELEAPPSDPIFVRHENATESPVSIPFTSSPAAPPEAVHYEDPADENVTLTPLNPVDGVPLKTQNKVNTRG